MLTRRRRLGTSMGGCFRAGALSFLLNLLQCGGVQAKLGETLPQLVKRFGHVTGMWEDSATGVLGYIFREKEYTVTAVMTRTDTGQSASLSEIYFSTAPLEANGDPPSRIVRGIMNVTAPGAKWLTAQPEDPESAAFITSDRKFRAVILPPDTEVNTDATFTLAVVRVPDGIPAERGALAKTSLGAPTSSVRDSAAAETDIQVGTGQSPAPPIHIDSFIIRTLLGKSHNEVQTLLGQPAEKFAQGYLYAAQVSAFWGNEDGYFIVLFAGDKARSFQVHTHTPLDARFVEMLLQNSPGAQFEPTYQARNLTGADWQDAQNGFAAFTTQMSEHEFLLTIDLTPWNERKFSPLHQSTKSHVDSADR